jgi:hypothetical protein
VYLKKNNEKKSKKEAKRSYGDAQHHITVQNFSIEYVRSAATLAIKSIVEINSPKVVILCRKYLKFC